MTVDILVHLDSQSPEGRIVEEIVSRDKVSPEEAALRLLKQLVGQRSPAEQTWGAFSSPEDSALLYDEVEEAYSLLDSSDASPNTIQRAQRSPHAASGGQGRRPYRRICRKTGLPERD